MIKVLAGTLKDNLALENLGLVVLQAGTNDSMIIQWPLNFVFGESIRVSGSRGEYIEMDVNDNLNGIVAMYMVVYGWLDADLG